jgi:hypothetical protein
METKKIFTENEENWQYNSRIYHGENIWLEYGEGYRLTIELIEQEVLENDGKNQDFYIYPYCFQIRHYIELRLKEIIWECKRLKSEEYNPKKDGHSLKTLWNKSRAALKEIWKDELLDVPDGVYDFIDELHTLDIKSDSFRYPINFNNESTLKGKEMINFKNLSENFANVKSYLESITDGISVLFDIRNNQ